MLGINLIKSPGIKSILAFEGIQFLIPLTMKSKIVSRSFYLLMTFLLMLASYGCKKDESKIVKEKVTGQVQKGPYINGTSITMSELNSSLAQTGNIFTTQISNNVGSFEIDDISLTSGYVEFSASGYYFDEVKGELSVAPLNLFALSDIRDISTVNVNILTHLEKQRVSYLTKQNSAFSESKKTAQGEILSIFGFNPGAINNSEMLDISVNNESNAILLAVSIILQGNRSVGDLTELLARISNDIKEDGNLNDATILTGLRNTTKDLDLVAIRSNLEKRYQNLGVSATIPNFEKYIKEFLAFTGEKPTTTLEPTTEISTTGATFNATVNPDYISTTVSFEWGETAIYGNSIPAIQNPVTGGSSVNISVAVQGLLPGTTYHLRVKAENASGVTLSSDTTFKTLGKVPEAVTTSATNIFFNSAILNGSVNGNYLSTTTTFEWGTTTDYGNTIIAVQSPVTGNSVINVSADLTGLTEETTYHYRIKAENSLGATYSNDKIFTSAGKSPIPMTKVAANIQMNTAKLNGSVNANGFSTTVIFEWGTTTDYGNTISAIQTPVTGNTYTDISADLTGLAAGTMYHFRIKAENEYGTKTSEDMMFTTLAPIVDIEGNVYNIRSIGNQIWMTENLKTTKYSNAATIAYGLYYPANDVSNVAKYGYLYDWAAAINQPAKYDTIMMDLTGQRVQGVCPTGWHLPSVQEWLELVDNFGGTEAAALKLKIADENYWLTPLLIEEPVSGFDAIPAGSRMIDGTFHVVGENASYWTSSQFWDGGGTIMGRQIYMYNFQPKIYINIPNTNNQPGSVGLSVRCLKD